ncbi:hypothetical protein B0H63DRAFT_531806 [Podospora didyma]|uniref:2EXR domain-containing protein n=1 Tax=Podospora didyma TaxID=330526 RepID=A0AAE0U818_9PEZI|nr:hypothetical protein B0H63DRAFT_531806 [Podospora didyma]
MRILIGNHCDEFGRLLASLKWDQIIDIAKHHVRFNHDPACLTRRGYVFDEAEALADADGRTLWPLSFLTNQSAPTSAALRSFVVSVEEGDKNIQEPNTEQHIDSFPNFIKLPKELRCEIFSLVACRLAVFDSRIRVDASGNLYALQSNKTIRGDAEFRRNSADCRTIMQVCSESKHVAVEHVVPGIQRPPGTEDQPGHFNRKFDWLSLSLDERAIVRSPHINLLATDDSLESLVISDKAMKNVQKLIIVCLAEFQTLETARQEHRRFVRFIKRKMPKLRHLAIQVMSLDTCGLYPGKKIAKEMHPGIRVDEPGPCQFRALRRSLWGRSFVPAWERYGPRNAVKSIREFRARVQDVWLRFDHGILPVLPAPEESDDDGDDGEDGGDDSSSSSESGQE